MPELSDDDKEDIVITIIKHFENPEPVITPPKVGKKYGGKFMRRSSSNKENRKSLSDKENDPGSLSPTNKVSDSKEEEKPQSEITINHESGENWLKPKFYYHFKYLSI